MCIAVGNNNTDDDGENYEEYNSCNCSSCNPTNITYTERHDNFTLYMGPKEPAKSQE